MSRPKGEGRYEKDEESAMATYAKQSTANRTRYTNEDLQNLRDNLAKVDDIFRRVQDGECSITRACYGYGFKMLDFRKIMSMLETITEPERFTSKVADIANLVTPEEMFYSAILGINENDPRLWDEMPDDARETMEWVMTDGNTNLTERENLCLREYYIDGKTLKEIGEEQGVTLTRIRDIVARTIRRLRRPATMRIITNGLSVCEGAKEEVENRKENLRLLLAEQMLRNDPEFMELSQKTRGLQCTVPPEADIMECEFSVRSYNCLTRAGVQTIKDLSEMDGDDFARVRNLGRKSGEEVIRWLKNNGYTDCILVQTYPYAVER